MDPVDRKQYLTAASTEDISVGSGGAHSTCRNSVLLTNSAVDARKGAELLLHFLRVEDWEKASEEELGKLKSLLAICR